MNNPESVSVLTDEEIDVIMFPTDDLRWLAREVERAILTKLRAAEPVAWQWRRKGDPWTLEKTFNTSVFATTNDSEVRPLFASPVVDEEVRKDAARYQHLVATCNVNFDPSEPWQLVIEEPGTNEDWEANLNAAIDAAIAARASSGSAK